MENHIKFSTTFLIKYYTKALCITKKQKAKNKNKNKTATKVAKT